jgi:hypothetical protein
MKAAILIASLFLILPFENQNHSDDGKQHKDQPDIKGWIL